MEVQPDARTVSGNDPLLAELPPARVRDVVARDDTCERVTSPAALLQL
jgi:hypothetical protein